MEGIDLFHSGGQTTERMALLVFEALAIALACLLFYLWNERRKISSKMPPGPVGHFLWGNAKQLDLDNPQKTYKKWQEEFGDIYTLNMSGQKVVVLSSEELIYDVLVKKADSFSGRPESVILDIFNGYMKSIAFSSNSVQWRMMKKTFLTCLKMYGDKLLHQEEITQDCIKDTIKSFRSHCGDAFNPESDIHYLTAEIICSLVCGKRLEHYTVDKIRQMEVETTMIFTPQGPGKELEIFPFLKYFGNPTAKQLKFWAKWNIKIHDDMIDERKKVFNLDDPKCVIDGLLRHQQRERHPNGKSKLSDDDIKIITRESIAAGVQTTFRAIHSFLAILTAHPQVQERLQTEVDEVVGEREPRLVDRPNMHYTEACILELLRYISHVPLLLPHMTMKDETLHNYLIPKGTQVFVNVYSLNHDERYWEKPWEFMPERFLDDEGHLVLSDHPNRKRLLPFGAGRRVCPGEFMARNRLFLFVSSFMQAFSFKPAEGVDKRLHDPRQYVPAFVLRPHDYKLHAVDRKKE